MSKIVSKVRQLKLPCEDIGLNEGLKLADRLLDVLSERGDGIGLAANQIGVQKKVCVIAVPDKENGQIMARKFINPQITKMEVPVLVNGEGCLSFLGQTVSTLRYLKITVTDSLNPDGLQLTGLEAIVTLHEADHLNGLTMFDRRIKKCGPNSKCPCGSDTKFKKCCMKKLIETGDRGSMRMISLTR